MIKFQYKDKCIVDYVQDYHNRDGECLVGVYACGQGGFGAVSNILDEIECRDDIPDWVADHADFKKVSS